MKKTAFMFMVLVTVFLVVVGNTLQAQTLVDQWGATGRGSAWPILNTASTPAGTGSMGGASKPSGASISGGFNTITLSSGETIVVKGTLEWVGGDPGSAYTALRYALTFQDSATLNNKNTTTAMWASSKTHYGYEFTPRSGGTDLANGAGGSGVIWTVNNGGGWNSTWSNGGGPIFSILQAPRLAALTKGMYDWAISVTALADGKNEVRFYIEKQHAAGAQSTFWTGGTATDAGGVSKKFNFISFWTNNDIDASVTGLNVAGVTVQKGSPITVTEPPWQPFYVDYWGTTPRGTAWKVKNDSTTLVGDAIMSGASKPSGASIGGGFGETISAAVGKAVIVTGQLEYVGGGAGSAYTGLRFALTHQDSMKLVNRNTDSAAWVTSAPSGAVKGSYGYEFTPRSGGTDLANGAGGSGVIWTVNNGGWNSTWSNNGGPIFSILQAPRLAEISKGVYNFAISVMPLADGTNEVRFYIEKVKVAGQQTTYWTGGVGIDKTPVTSKFNFINFWINNDIEASTSAFKLIAVKVDKGNPITVTEAPWQAFYVDYWGTTPRGTAWKVKNDSTTLVGDAIMSGASKPSGASIGGGFGETISAAVGKAVIVTGQLEYVGGGAGSAYTGLRFALTYQDSMQLKNRNTDSAAWVTKAPSGATKGSYGYEFTPRSGGTDLANGSGGSGVIWTVNNGNWNSTFSNNGGPIFSILQSPRLAEISQGVYNFAISVMPLADGTNEVRFYIEKVKVAGQQTTYWTGGVGIDKTPVSSKFNFINFWINNDIEAATSAFKLIAVKVDKGNSITVTTPPWQAYYVDQWGFIGGRMYGWTFLRGDFVGNAGIGGTAPNKHWAAIRGGFDPVTPTTAKALLVTGKVEFVGGGFQAANSLRVGLFYSTQAGKVIVDSAKATLPDSSRWDGFETYHSGYLFIPPSGTNGLADWTGLSAKASSGAVANGAWLHNDYPASGGSNLTWNYTLGSDLQTPANAVAGAGIYNLTMSVAVGAGGANDVRFKLAKTDNSYIFTSKVLDTKSVKAATMFNSINMAISGAASATAMKLTDIKIDYVDVASVPITEMPAGVTGVESAETTPMEFGLAQNYPNPFNPSTTISYDVAKAAHVTIRVYDVLGRMVTQLVDAMQKPSSYTVQWNPGNLSSGTYLYRIDARYEDGSGSFSAVKKLMYMK